MVPLMFPDNPVEGNLPAAIIVFNQTWLHVQTSYSGEGEALKCHLPLPHTLPSYLETVAATAACGGGVGRRRERNVLLSIARKGWGWGDFYLLEGLKKKSLVLLLQCGQPALRWRGGRVSWELKCSHP